MRPRDEMDARACPECGYSSGDFLSSTSDGGCDCADCREDARMALGAEYDRYEDDEFDGSSGNDAEDYDDDDDVDYDDGDFGEDDLEDMFDDDLDDYDEEADEDYDDEDFDADEDDEDDLNDFLETDDLDEDMFDDFDEDVQASMLADDFEEDLLDGGTEDVEYDGFLDDADDFEDTMEDMDRRVLKRPCAHVRRIIIRKNRDGEEPLSADDRAAICEAVERARGWADKADAVFDGIWNRRRRRRRRRRKDAWENNATITTWLGSKDDVTIRQIRVTRRRVRRIRNYLKTGLRIVVVQHATGKRSYLCSGANAYYTGDRRVYLCPNFFKNKTTDDQARTIIHELVHRLGWGHAKLPGVGKVSITGSHAQRAQDLARRFPRRAQRNPVNIAWFFSQI